MSYTLRIIDQTKVGAEERRNVFIGNEYSVLMKTNTKQDSKGWHNRFKEALNSYHDFYQSKTPPENETIVGFIYANDATYPIHDYNVVYIVGSEGQTIERVYGLYQKY